MAQEMKPEELRVQAWLEERGYVTEYEPNWIPAGEKRPDFWAEAQSGTPDRMWVEVKRFDRDRVSKAMSMAVRVERGTRFPTEIHGSAHLAVSEGAKESSVQSVVNLFLEHGPKHKEEKTTLAFVHQVSDAPVLRRAEVHSETGVKRLWVRGPATGLLACPSDFCSQESYSAVTYWDETGRASTTKAYRVLNWGDHHECSLTASLDPADPVLNSFGIGSSGSTNTRQRTIRLLKYANSQFESVDNLRRAPAIVMLVPDQDYLDDQMIQAGCYGALTVPFHLPTGAAGTIFHGRYSVFRPNKNNYISAAIRLRQDGSGTYFPNPYAQQSIPEDAAVFSGLTRANVSFNYASANSMIAPPKRAR